MTSFSALQRLARPASRAPGTVQQRCDLCREPVPQDHRHVVEVEAREIACACRACALLFENGAASLGKYRLIPDRRFFLRDCELSDAQWERCRIPVGLAFFFYSTPARRQVVFYPNPMGPTQSMLDPSTWDEFEATNPVLKELRPDVEALLVNRTRGARHMFLVPIEDCYRLAGLIRLQWKGLGGGHAVWNEIERFFHELGRRCKTMGKQQLSDPHCDGRAFQKGGGG